MKAEIVSRISLLDVRGQCGLKQQELADLAGVARDTVRKAETGQVISLLKAYDLLRAVNKVRRQSGQPELSIDEIDWKVEGR